MGLNVTCDCCQKPTEKPTEVGYINKAYYCSECLPEYEEYIKKIDDYHDSIAKQIQFDLENIKTDWLFFHPGASLP